MLKKSGILLLTVISIGIGIVFQSFAQESPPFRVQVPSEKPDLPLFAEDRLVVKFKASAPTEAVEALKAENEATETRRSERGGFVTLNLPVGSDVLKKADTFNKNALVEYAHPDYFVYKHFVPNDTFYDSQWHFDDDNTINTGGASTNPFGGANGGGIGMEQAWNIATGAQTVIVAVIDTGVAYEDFNDPEPANCYSRFGTLRKCPGPTIDTYFQAPDLANTNFLILPGSDFVNSDDHPNDDDSHGTHVSGTVAQSTNNSLGVAGIAFNTTIMPVKVLDASGSGLLSIIADAILFATDNGADVINMSLGGTANVQVLEDAVAYAFNNGVTVVTSAGNDFNAGNPVNYPAAYDAYVIAVGATRYDETRSSYSSTGFYVDVTAPGGDNSVDQNNDGFADGVLQQTFGDNSDTSDFAYWFFQGTSMASPHVAGLAALLLSVDPSLTPTQVRAAIENTAEDKGIVGRDDEYGHGIIDAHAALLSISPAVVSITLSTDGAVSFGVMGLNSIRDTTVSGINDVETVTIITGPANIDVRSTVFSDGGNVWSLSGASGSDQVKWEFSTGTVWNTFSTADTLFDLANNLASSDTQDMFLRLTTPTVSSSGNEHSATVTFVATAP